VLSVTVILTVQVGVHGGDEHERGEGHAAGGAGDGDFAVLKGLAHDFEGAAAELGEFVEEEDAVVGHADFAGAGIGPPPRSPASLMVWWGERKGRVAMKILCCLIPNTPSPLS
jgi:hypothetical protein